MWWYDLRGWCCTEGSLVKYQPSSPRTTHLLEPVTPYNWLGIWEFCCNSQQKSSIPHKFQLSHTFLLDMLSFEAPSTRVLWKSLLIWSRLLTAVQAESALARVIWKANQLNCWLSMLPSHCSPLLPLRTVMFIITAYWRQCGDLFSFLSAGVLEGSCWEQQTSSSSHRDQNLPWSDILGVETISFKGKLTIETVSEQHCWFQSCREQFSLISHPSGGEAPTSLTCASVFRACHWCATYIHVLKLIQAYQLSEGNF